MKTILGNNFKDNQSGVSAIEFAIVGPMFIFLLFGILAYGIYLGAVNSVQQLAADAVRSSVAGLDEAERSKLAERFVKLNAGDYILLLPEHVKVTVNDDEVDSNQFEVAIEYDAAHLPIWNLYTPLPLPETTIVRKSTIRMGGI